MTLLLMCLLLLLQQVIIYRYIIHVEVGVAGEAIEVIVRAGLRVLIGTFA